MLLMVIGGSASGKSAYAEDRAVDAAAGGSLYYIAAMQPYGEDAAQRIRRHRQLREGKGFTTIERYTDLAGLCNAYPDLAGSTVLLECLSNLTANEMFDPAGAGEEKAADAILSGIKALHEKADTLIVVTTDVFGAGLPAGELSDGTRSYCRLLGEIHCRLAQMAEEVVEVVYSIPLRRKG